MPLYPKTIKQGPFLGAAKMAAQRRQLEGGQGSIRATRLFKCYVCNGLAIVAQSPVTAAPPTEWQDLYVVGPALDVAIAFDGCFEHNPNRNAVRRFEFVSVGDPWIFRVLPDKSLVGQQGADGDVIELAPPEVTLVTAIRGWQSVVAPHIDQGLIVAYIRNGRAYYRSLAKQPDSSTVWEEERQVTGLDTTSYPVTGLSVFRTNDYRTGFLTEINKKIYLSFSQRTWEGMATPDELLVSRVRDYQMGILKEYYANDEYIGCKVNGYTMQLLVPVGAYHNENIKSSVTDYGMALIEA